MPSLAPLLWLAQTCAHPVLGCFVPTPPCPAESLGRDDSGIERLEIDERVPVTIAAEAVTFWMVDPGFTPFPAALNGFATEVRGPEGGFRLCTLASVAARQKRPLVPSGERLAGGLVLLSFDPARRGEPRFPLDEVFATARAAGLLTASQKAQLGELDGLARMRVRDLERSWKEVRRAPYLGYSRKIFFRALRAYDDPQPVLDKGGLEPGRFFDRGQRESLRTKGHTIRGRCLLQFTGRSSRVELASCPLAQLAEDWNRLGRAAAPALPRLRAVAARAHVEVETMRLDIEASPAVAAARVFGLLSAIDGLERVP